MENQVIGIFIAILMWGAGIIIFISMIRYSIDSSKTSKKFDELLNEVSLLRDELKKQKENKHIIDRRI